MSENDDSYRVEVEVTRTRAYFVHAASVQEAEDKARIEAERDDLIPRMWSTDWPFPVEVEARARIVAKEGAA